MTELLKVEGLSASSSHEGVSLLRVSDVSFTLDRKRRLAIVGESGSGKSLTALAIMGLLPETRYQTSGRVLFKGNDLRQLSDTELRGIRGRHIAMAFQEPSASLNPSSRVGSLLIESVSAHLTLSRTATRQKAEQMLSLVGIAEPSRILASYSHELSGGMLQRVALAAALSCSPDLLIADQPTSGVDPTTQAQLFDVLGRVQAETGLGILMITHNFGVVSENADDVAVMYGGQIMEKGPVRRVLQTPLHPYTAALLASIPPPAPVGSPEDRRLPMLPQAPPADNQGCAFRSRCPVRQRAADRQRCETEPPTLQDQGDEHFSRCHFPEAL